MLQASVEQAGLRRHVAFIEATIDPQRDTAAQLRAYQTEFGTDWTLLTSSAAHVSAFWKRFGVDYQIAPEGNPPGVAWLTHKQLTYDLHHTDGF